MATFFSQAFIGLVISLAAVEYYRRTKKPPSQIISVAGDDDTNSTSSSSSGDAVKEEGSDFNKTRSSQFSRFQQMYIIVYLLMNGADWLQGPYVYALYESYGYKQADIATLFLCGFLSSMIAGTFIGAIADKYGRRFMCIVFGICYSLSALTKLSPDFTILMTGRFLAGIATSLLYSSFEAWMVHEHNLRGFNPTQLSNTFTIATFGNGIAAIVSGLVAGFFADRWGYVSPFMLSLVCLIVGTIVVAYTWSENYGDASIDVQSTFSNAWTTLKSDRRVLILGMVQSLFEAAMYTFIFMWTPALQEEYKLGLPFGTIFASFMVSMMIGSSLYDIAINHHYSPEQIGRVIYLTATLSLLVPYLTTSTAAIFISFLIFETCCGVYYPCQGTLRGKYIPGNSRAAIMNFFRVGLNFLVVVVLLKVSELAYGIVFLICAAWLAIACILHTLFIANQHQPSTR
eukprot:TRINITY_DN7294_c0_g1_i1.p1 TRINITY_DN7294_c0_g1~~TRINITY_DN7294_c0_g1_i1.p1  ORF type:complete len:457 (+),score=57.99 TRINITY_DN7294_c0_g1_i1:37-1407(+)